MKQKTESAHNRRRKRTIIAAICIILLILLMVWVYRTDNAAPKEPRYDGGADYDFGIEQIDLRKSAGFSFKLRNIPFSASTAFSPDGASSNFNDAVTSCGILVENTTKSPITVKSAVGAFADVDEATGQRISCENPGLRWAMYTYDVTDSVDSVDDLDPASDGGALRHLESLSLTQISDESGLISYQEKTGTAVTLEPNKTYQFIWLLWVDQNASATPAAENFYGITVDAIARKS